jgi:hypothetical protein
MNEDYSSFSTFTQNLSNIKEKLENFTDEYSLENEFLPSINYNMEDDFKTESINIIIEMEKSIQIFIDSTRDSSDNETYSEIMDILSQPLKKCIYNRRNTKDYACNKIYKPRPLSNNICKGLFNSNKKSKILIAKRVPVKTII